MDDFMTVEDAAKYLKRTKSLICKICRDGGFPDARRVGHKMWIIPISSVMNYKPGLQGFAAVKARKMAEDAALRAMLREATSASEPKRSEK